MTMNKPEEMHPTVWIERAVETSKQVLARDYRKKGVCLIEGHLWWRFWHLHYRNYDMLPVSGTKHIRGGIFWLTPEAHAAFRTKTTHPETSWSGFYRKKQTSKVELFLKKSTWKRALADRGIAQAPVPRVLKLNHGAAPEIQKAFKKATWLWLLKRKLQKIK